MVKMHGVISSADLLQHGGTTIKKKKKMEFQNGEIEANHKIQFQIPNSKLQIPKATSYENPKKGNFALRKYIVVVVCAASTSLYMSMIIMRMRTRERCRTCT